MSNLLWTTLPVDELEALHAEVKRLRAAVDIALRELNGTAVATEILEALGEQGKG
jgi:hypothetical protein